MKTYEATERSSFAPQRPRRTPWPVVCLLAASSAFLAGHLYSAASLQSSEQQLVQQRAAITPGPALHGVAIPGGMRGEFLTGSDNPIADIVASVSPSVVSIETVIRKHGATSSVDVPDLLFSNPTRVPALRDPERFEAHGSGSGIIVDPDGYILTNAHVIKGADEIKVTLNSRREYVGRVVGRDAYSDVALVKINAHNLPVARMADARKTRPGDWAIAIGSPLGLNQTVTMGIVSAVGRSLADLNNNVDLIQTDAAINPGNSGGPLLNIHGEVIGINMAIRTDAQNIGFCIPIDIARDAADAMMHRRPLNRPYLGISMIDFDESVAKALGVSGHMTGVLVSKVTPESPAARSGLKEGDLIQRINNKPVTSGQDVQAMVRKMKVGGHLDLQVFQSGKTRSVQVVLRSHPVTTEFS